MKHIRHALLFALLASAGCRSAAPPPRIAAPPSGDGAPPPLEAPAWPPQAAVDPTRDWFGFFIDEEELRDEGGLALEAYGLAVSRVEFEAGRRRAEGEDDAAYRERVRRQLLALRWLEGTSAAEDPAVRAALRARLREALAEGVVGRLAAEIVRPVGEADVRAEYQRRIRDYQTPEMVRIRMIQVDTPTAAAALLARFKAGEEFAALALAESRHASRENGGLMAPFPRGTLGIAELEALAFRLEPGGTGTVETPAGVFIVDKVAAIPGRTEPYDAVAQALRAELERKAVEDARRSVLAQMELDLR
ncbi:MAG: peptidyl-prolyl cis-trans isomerase [Candidatus Sumerlaeia bacterium]|nr:peptidyl-prolyl cis-trans isomerase [Candidatus Sumerlaeia bacterium]